MIGSKAGLLEGVVLDQDKPASNATVVAIPEEKYRKLHERYGVGSTDQNGLFTIHGLAPAATPCSPGRIWMTAFTTTPHFSSRRS